MDETKKIPAYIKTKGVEKYMAQQKPIRSIELNVGDVILYRDTLCLVVETGFTSKYHNYYIKIVYTNKKEYIEAPNWTYRFLHPHGFFSCYTLFDSDLENYKAKLIKKGVGDRYYGEQKPKNTDTQA